MGWYGMYMGWDGMGWDEIKGVGGWVSRWEGSFYIYIYSSR